LNLVLDFAEHLADLVFDGVRATCALLEASQVGEQLAVDEVTKVIAGTRRVVIELAVGGLWRRPALPAICWIEDVGIALPFKFGFRRLVVFKRVQILQERKRLGEAP
jgi:hypothetical protein